DDTGCGAPNGCTFGLEFQCNELAQRYAYYAWGEPASWYGYGGDQGSAYQMWNAAPALPVPLAQYANGGGTLPRVGDLMIFNQGWLGSYWDGAGHVAVVSNVDTVDGYVSVVEQNATSTGTDTFALSGTTVTAYGYTPVMGWLRPMMVAPLPPTENTTKFTVSWSPPTGLPAPSSYVLWVQPDGGAWQQYITTTATSANAYGFPGHTYSFSVEAIGPGYDTGPPTEAQATTSVIANATPSTSFTALYGVNGFGALQPGSSPVLDSSSWRGWDIVRGGALDATGHGGVLLDGWGGLHGFGDVTSTQATGYWSGWDIARAVAMNNQNQGYVLDGWGGLHPFAANGVTLPPDVQQSTYFYGFDIARGLALFSDSSGGVVVDGWGGIHPFTIAGVSAASVVQQWQWPGWNIVRGVVLLPGSTASHFGGYELDGWGGIHPFGSAGDVPPPVTDNPYWFSWDVARGIALLPGSSTAGYVVDAFGGMHPFGGAPAVDSGGYTPGMYLTHGITIH
ncbi:MAG TPA: CHAP domain-containing protein, partial [Dehalococcoidia bacterium]|nr:CHAP domain-containing protein [Dehalococcoidia bacterium]